MSSRINIGPVHPNMRDSLRLVVDVEGDTVTGVEPHIGLLHRGVEKLAENRMYMQNMAYMEKLDYAAPMAYADLYMAAVEAAVGMGPDERAAYERTILLELQRIASHLLWLGSMAGDLSPESGLSMWALRDRDMVLRLLQEVSGSRMFYVNMRLRGLVRDFQPGFEERVLSTLKYIEKKAQDYESSMDRDPLFKERTVGVGKLSKEAAIELGVTGPVLRASGVESDARKDRPYYAYEKLYFRPHIKRDGDCFARYKVRMMELHESIRIVRDAFKSLPSGESVGVPIGLAVPEPNKEEVRVSRETPRGEAFIYMVAGRQGPYRLSIRSPSFINLAALGELAKGCRMADLFAILNSLDVVMGDVDR